MATTMEAARAETLTEGSGRRAEVLESLDHLIQVYDTWSSDPKAPDVPSEALEQAIIGAIEVCEHGDIPAQLRQICTVAVPRLRFEWDQYAEGMARRPNGTPTARFWAAFKAVMDARDGAKPFVPKRPEPVAELMLQGVSYQQIALHIYGYNGVGPFIRADGLPDIAKIKQEAAQPGSVVPADWLHPYERQRQKEWEQSVESRLVSVKEREDNQQETSVDRASIEDFVLQGAAPDVIARVKGVTLAEVLAVKDRLDAEERQRNAKAAANDAEIVVSGGAAIVPGSEDRPADTPLEVEAFIQEQIQANLGVPEIVAALKERGVKKSAKEVQKIAEKLLETA